MIGDFIRKRRRSNLARSLLSHEEQTVEIQSFSEEMHLYVSQSIGIPVHDYDELTGMHFSL